MSKKVKVWGNGFPFTTVKINGGSGPSTDTYTKAEIDEKVNQINSSIQQLSNLLSNNFYDKTAIDEKLTNNYYTKTTIDTKLNILNSLINQKTSPQEHYLKNKYQLVEGKNINLIMNDDTQKITFDYSSSAEPTTPTPDGIYSFDTVKKIYRKYDETTIFNPSENIKYCEGNQYNTFPSDYNLTIPRTIFNEPLIFIYKNRSEESINNLFVACLAYCPLFNQSLDFSDVSNLTMIGGAFLKGCISFNSPITFKANKIISIGEEFMMGCEKFNNNINNLFTPALQEIRAYFLQGCHDFNQNIDLSSVNCDADMGYDKIVLINFMKDCFSFAQAKIIMGTKTTAIFKQNGYAPNMTEGMRDSCASTDVNALSYQVGFHFEGTNIDQLKNFVISTTEEITVNVFQNKDDGPYKKIIVNGVA